MSYNDFESGYRVLSNSSDDDEDEDSIERYRWPAVYSVIIFSIIQFGLLDLLMNVSSNIYCRTCDALVLTICSAVINCHSFDNGHWIIDTIGYILVAVASLLIIVVRVIIQQKFDEL